MFIGGLIEHWGRGLSMMSKECEEAGLPKPRIIDNGYMVKVIFFRPENINRVPVEHQLNISKTPVEHQHDEISTPLVTLISAIGENWYSAKELREIMGFKSKSSFIKNYLNPAQKVGFIQFEDTKNPKSPNQRYGLTEKGKQILNQKKS